MLSSRKRQIAFSLGLIVCIAVLFFGLTWREIQTQRQNMALFEAVRNDDADGVSAALGWGAEADAHETGRHLSIWEILRERFRVKSAPKFAPTPLLIALHSPLDVSALNRSESFAVNDKIVRLLLEYGADTNIRDENGNTPVMLALGDNQPATLKLLQEHGANIQVRDRNGLTLLMRAATYGTPEIMRLVLRYDRNVDAHWLDGSTALFAAIRGDNVEAARLLLQSGANPALEDYNGNTALSLARVYSRADIATLLQRALHSPSPSGR